MQRELTSLRRSVPIVGLLLAAAVLARVLPMQIGYAHPKTAQAGDSSAAHKPVAALSPYIEVHTHLDETNVDGSMQAAIGDMPQENLSRMVVDFGDEPKSIPFNIEDGKFAHGIRRGKHLPDFHQGTPPRFSGDAIPNIQRACQFGVHLCGFQKLLAADDVQGRPRPY